MANVDSGSTPRHEHDRPNLRLVTSQTVDLTGLPVPFSTHLRVSQRLYQEQRDNGTISDKDDKVLRRELPPWITYHREIAFTLGIMGPVLFHLRRRPFPRGPKPWRAMMKPVAFGFAGACAVTSIVPVAVCAETYELLERPTDIMDAVEEMVREDMVYRKEEAVRGIDGPPSKPL